MLIEGQFSWDKPIEHEMDTYLSGMLRQMESIACRHDNKSIREGASNYADAYRTALYHLRSEVKLREKIKTPAS